MNTTTTKSGMAGRTPIVIMAAVVLVVGGYFALGALFPDSAERALASGDSKRVVDALTKIDNEALAADDKADLRGQAIEALKNAPLEDVFDRLRSDDLSDEERERLERNLGELMRESMTRNVDEYENAAEEQKVAVLDRHIDEAVAFRDKMAAYREKHKDDPETQRDGERRQGARRQPSKEDRKRHMEGTNPDSMIRMFSYWGKMQTRATERGVKLWGPGQRQSNDKKD